MAAASPRKPRRASGRHRKSSHRAQWLRAGAVGFGLAAAIISGQGVASADTDDSSASRDSSASEASGKRSSIAGRPSAGPDQGESSSPADGAGDDSGDEPAGGDDDDAGSADADLDTVLDEELVEEEQEPQTPVDEDDLPSDTSTDDGESSTPYQKPDAAGRSSAATGSATPAPASGPESEQTGDTPSSETPAGDTDDESDPTDSETPDDSAESPADSDDSEDGEELPEEVKAAVREWVDKILRSIGRAPVDGEPVAPVSLDEVLQGLWLSNRNNQTSRSFSEFMEGLGERMLGQGAVSVGWIPVVGSVMYGANFLSNLGALSAAIKRGDSADIADELRDLGRDLIGMIPIIGAPTAALLYEMEMSAAELASAGTAGAAGAAASQRMSAVAMAAMAAPPVGSPEHFLAVLQRAVTRLATWPGTPKNFVDITNYQTDRTLDAADDQLDGIVANTPPGSAASWVPDAQSLFGLFLISAIPGYTFSDTLNAMGDFLNRVVPPFKIADGAGTLDIISPYKIMGAAVVGAATLLKDMMNGIYDPVQWEINIIKATTGATVTAADLQDFDSLALKVVGGILGDGGAFTHPERAWDITLPTWTEAQVNPYTVTTYVALVGLYKRFQEMATLTTFTTWTTYDSWHYTNALGMYAAGTFHAVDPDGGSIVFRADGTLGRTYTTEGNALVTINTVGGGFTYTPPALWDPKAQGAAFRHRSTAEDPEERFDWVTVQAYSADGVPYNIRVGIEIINGTNAAPTYTGVTGQNTDALGVVKGKINGSDSDGDPLRFYLVDSSVNGLTGNSAYTKNGAGNGGIVTLNELTGEFTYVSSATAGANQSFQVRINDRHHGNTIVTITVPNTTSINPGNVTTPTQGVVTGTPPASTNKPGTFVSYTLGGTPAKGTVTSFNPATGAFTYVRNAGLGHSTTANDIVTIIGTDADGRQVTLHLNVQPSVPNTAPTLTLTTPPTVGTLNGTTQTSTGKFTYFDADGDAPIWPTSVTSSRGGTVTIAADGTFTYTSNLTVAQRHAVARIGAAGSTFDGVALNAWEDAFTATVSDGFGGTAQVTVKVPIYAINANPTLSVPGLSCGFGICTVTITTTDPDGDSLSGGLPTSNPGNGNAWQTLAPRGSITANSGNGHTMSWTGNSNGAGTQQTGINRYTVYDGYYRVTNGVVDSSYFSRAWVEWNGTSRSFGN
ncbi:hypothetical protein [Mycolicibacterium parafortuitum]|uniref:Putative hemolysin [Cellvibrio japonicus Ueda107] n=1 Tax=Mycolicibacterium parafortuitum TaxID=39692 RepID=A0A375YKQ0_MYCPF|nr:hypothetical protein [Mycolicibacterium parafortuitum]ORB25576.1 hypothetical protein BST38_27265 [Mycolicibacterium parafortuitum]SRX81715.1 putative hemolysin [Cellvibrio japonicus Ueda107] [Mycolicibacterium parafortuitum]